MCLLELGLGESFLNYYTEDGHAVRSPVLESQGEKTSMPEPNALKQHLVRLTCEKLPRHMGRRYAAVVNTCLTCLDHDNTDFGDEQEFLDGDGVLVGVRYIEKILSQLHAICA